MDDAQQKRPYAPGAYHSNSTEPLPAPKRAKDADRSGLLNTHLVFGHYAHLEPEMEVTAQLEGEEHRIYELQQEAGNKQEVYCDASRWRFQNSSKISHLLFVLKLMSFFFTPGTWGIGILVGVLPKTGRQDVDHLLALIGCGIVAAFMALSLALFMYGKKTIHKVLIGIFSFYVIVVYVKTGSLWGDDELHIALWLGTFLYSMGALGCDGLLWLYSKISHHDGSEFNRTDGMLRFKRRFRPLFVAPFEEFDPVLQRLPSGHGSHDYALWLYHRYTRTKVCLAVKVHALGLDQHNALAFWDCLQRYMDVTQPLPDLPVLEQSRHLDPVTAAHDARTGRPERRWRDQALQGWQTGGARQLALQLTQYPWQTQPCVLKARIDSSLSIAAYYRAKEAKGIKITPRATDFGGARHG